MPTLAGSSEVLAVEVSCSDDALTVVLDDARTVSVPILWFPRLLNATSEQRNDWELIGGGIGIHWEAIDEDISVASLLRPERFMRLADLAARSDPLPARPGRVSSGLAENAHQGLIEEFDQAMHEVYRRALSEAGYKAARFLEMLDAHHGLQTARILLHAANVSEGYTALWERGRLDLTVEAVIHNNPKWHSLFTSEELAICRSRLQEYGYFKGGKPNEG